MRFSFFGAALDTGNLGVSALCYATLFNLAAQDPEAEITVFDNGRGREKKNLNFGNDGRFSFYRQGAVNSRRFYRPENLRLMKLLGVFGGMGNEGIKTISSSDAVLDISGGDSFTDLYGSRRFDTVTLPKLIALQQKRPLILLPQTYGPFTDKGSEKKASEIVKNARCAWARDNRSFRVLKGLLGSSFDPQIHQCGVDVAFGLPIVQPPELPENLLKFLGGQSGKIGINVSGLIYNDWEKSKKQFGFKADYRLAVRMLLRRFLLETDCSIALVPHVITPKGHFESDEDACRDLVEQLDDYERERVVIVPAYTNPCEIKWVISQLDWFCGTRMHATIAALSSGVPVSAISYSPKTLGVFETCGQGSHVADPQVMTEEELVDCLWSSWKGKNDALSQFDRELPGVKLLVNEQMKSILDNVRS